VNPVKNRSWADRLTLVFAGDPQGGRGLTLSKDAKYRAIHHNLTVSQGVTE
jgi:hypothetical protein